MANWPDDDLDPGAGPSSRSIFDEPRVYDDGLDPGAGPSRIDPGQGPNVLSEFTWDDDDYDRHELFSAADAITRMGPRYEPPAGAEHHIFWPTQNRYTAIMRHNNWTDRDMSRIVAAANGEWLRVLEERLRRIDFKIAQAYTLWGGGQTTRDREDAGRKHERLTRERAALQRQYDELAALRGHWRWEAEFFDTPSGDFNIYADEPLPQYPGAPDWWEMEEGWDPNDH